MRKFWFWLLQRLGLWKTGSIYYIGGSDVLPPPLPDRKSTRLNSSH